MRMDLKIPILLVDDRPENIVALAALLGEMDIAFELVKTYSGNEALRQSLKHDFALVLLDVQMPDMNGIETANLLRLNPKTCHLPIIFITAGMSERDILFSGYATGAVDYLIKPIEPLVMRSKVKVFCDLYAQRKEIEYHKSHLEAKVEERTRELSTLAGNLRIEVDARRASEVALQATELRMQRVIDSAYEAFIGIDALGTVLDWNHQAEHLFGWSKEEVVGQLVAELIIPPRFRAAHLAGLQRFSDGTHSANFAKRMETCAQDKSGREFPVELSVWSIPNAGMISFGSFVRDISERKRAEEDMRLLNEGLEARVQERTQELRHAMDQIIESEKLASLGSIVAGVAHELNTPIGNILMMASSLNDRVEKLGAALEQGTLTRSMVSSSLSGCDEASKLIVRSAGRASELIESFKSVAVDQASQRRRVFDLRALLSDIINTVAIATRHAHIAIDLRVASGIEMNSFPGDMEQIFNNFIMNSLHHGYEGRDKGCISIDAQQIGNMVEIVYQDDGCGIPIELHKKVFEPFYTTKLGQGGSGLGMFIVHNLVHASLKGEIKLESDSGKGVRFTLTIPRITP